MFLVNIKNNKSVINHLSPKWIGFQGVYGFLYFTFTNKATFISTHNLHYFFFDNKLKNQKSRIQKKLENFLSNANFGYSLKVKVVGVGYKIDSLDQNKVLSLKFGFSHDILFESKRGVKCKRLNERSSIYVFSFIDKQILKNFVNKIKKFRPVEPYKGKGLRYLTESIKRKEGKKSNL